MSNESQSTRRRFIQSSVAASSAVSVPWIVPARALGREENVAASEKITLGVIGIGPRCRYVLKGMLTQPDVQCVAIADVQASRREAGKKQVDDFYGNDDCVLYRDFRELLARKDIDAVLIATGDRWHTTASVIAANAGKDIYCEKPCGLTIAYCQELAETIKNTKRVFQAGTQRRSVANFQKAVELAHTGQLGKIHTLHASAYMPEVTKNWLPREQTPDPKVVDWNMWLGPAPWRPFNSQYVAGRWRGHYDFESGSRLLDWCAHTVDLCQWANKADETMPIEYIPSDKNIIARYANGVKLVIHFLETPFGKRPGWHQHLGTCPVRFEGDQGWVEVGDSGGIEVSSDTLKKQISQLPKKESGLDVKAHSRNFFDCIKSRKAPAANANVMRHSHIASHAAAMSWLLNRNLKFDPKKEEFINDNEANGLRTRPARQWQL